MPGRRRFVAVLVSVLGLLTAANLLRAFCPGWTGVVLGPVLAAGLVLLARRCGLSWSDLGLGRRALVRGGPVAAAAVVTVAIGYGAAAAWPLTRDAFLDSRYQLSPRTALVTAFVVIPLGTVLLEEVAFRGVLQGLFTRHRSVGWGLGLSSALFGFWHVLPSLGLSRANRAVGDLVSGSANPQALTVLSVVVVTAAGGLLLAELRRRSSSLLACGGLHWAVNGLAVLVTAGLPASGLA